MKKILLINAMKEFAHSQGRLNTTLHQFAKDFLEKRGYEVQETIIDNGYQIETEIDKIKWADLVIYQMPAWWMGEPWIMKKWMDDVFTAGHGVLYSSDGRTRSDDSKKYGSGGLLQGKRYMLSVTWNAPLEAFTDKEQFFHGMGVDCVYLPFHKANQFIGMTPEDTFICNDVMKEPNVEQYLKDYAIHLEAVLA